MLMFGYFTPGKVQDSHAKILSLPLFIDLSIYLSMRVIQ